MKTLLICIVFIVPSMAQDDSTFFWGVKAGFTFSHIEGAGKRTAGKLNHPTKNTGIILGINFNRIINDRNTQQAELYFVHKGSKWGQPLIGLGYDGDYAIYNLEFFGFSLKHNVKGRLEISDKYLNFSLIAGAYYEYNISAHQEWTVEWDLTPIEFHAKNFRNELNKHQFGYILGIKVPFFYEDSELCFLWYSSLTELYDKNKVSFAEFDFDDKNNLKSYTFSLTIEFPLK